MQHRSSRPKSAERAAGRNSAKTLLVAAASLLIVAGAGHAAAQTAVGAPLPAGYLSTRGNQIVDSHGTPVRIACVGGLGTVVDSPLTYGFGPYTTLDTNVAAMRRFGFNCIRVDFNDKCVQDPALMAQFDQLVAACKKHDMKVIFDHHNDEATAADWGNAAQQTNGLWYDKGPGSDGTDDALHGGDKGTVTQAVFEQDWVTLAKRYAGNSTVIGFDLDNEPHVGYGTPNNGENWGGGGPGDIRRMYITVGDAIQKVDPGALIICEGLMDVTDKSSPIWWDMDLTHAVAKPVILDIPHKVVYSVHEYPNQPVDSGPAYIARMNKDWGFLVERNIAPVWIGEMGESMDVGRPDSPLERQLAWGRTILPYMNGEAPGGPRFTGDQQPISGDWWAWGCNTGESPDGCLDPSGSLRPAQAPFIEQMLYRPK